MKSYHHVENTASGLEYQLTWIATGGERLKKSRDLKCCTDWLAGWQKFVN